MSDKICPHCGQPMVIPEDELRAAENRIKLLDGLSSLCAWDKFEFQLNQKQRHARESWDRIMKTQTIFENKYC